MAWVFFRAADLPTALAMLRSMAGLQQGAPGAFEDLVHDGRPLIVGTALIAVFMPNVVDIFRRYRPALLPAMELRRIHAVLRALQWRPRPWIGIGVGALAGCGLIAILGWQSEFLAFSVPDGRDHHARDPRHGAEAGGDGAAAGGGANLSRGGTDGCWPTTLPSR